METLGVSVREVDHRLDSLIWALRRDAEEAAERVPGRNLWVAVTSEEPPLLRIYVRPRKDVPSECELMWVEEKP
jgi:hypothetical protein